MWRRMRRYPLGLIGLAILVLFVLVAVFAAQIAPYSYESQDLARVLEGPSRAHLFGTDDLGRDILSRLIWGARPSIAVGVVGVGIGVVIGVPIGMVAGFRPGWVDSVLTALTEVVLTFPQMVLSIALVAVMGSGITSVIVAIAASTAPAMAVMARASTLSERNREYVEAARALGMREPRILLWHVLRNIFPSVMTEATLRVSQAILIAAALGFLGLGVQPPLPEWGTMLSQGRNFLAVAPHMSIFAGVFIALLVLGFNLTGDMLRDIYDPRLKDV